MEGFEKIDYLHTRFKHPFTMIVSGSTGSGKSEWVKKFLDNLTELINSDTNISLVFYCYGELNKNILLMQRKGYVDKGKTRVIVHNGVPSGGEDFIHKQAIQSEGSMLLVLDDLMVGIDQRLIETIFTRGSHNWKMSVILISQHLFSKELKIPRNNSHYLLLMRNPAGALQIRTLAMQIFPSHSKYFLEAYGDATKENFGYLLVDIHPSTPEVLRLRTHIYPNENTIIYLPK
uniref:Uncharacterized protein n=4 Tax=Meloidogyne TaxID=189290 RepID=A0A6V7UIR3_MELEN|nr:unnamed protein product [Meloidogyne enterolobii]CAD2193972.1 unnamed protein product [Meloidogyne enterolobii]CAD2194182.1 unnamed protein product [Meloidogyne enterolobii]CAD2198387.1 unnamed protein product [Meloidogyne enterolobii]CAD2203333.1 unnamed protein product [Meloidogyne enterolobii]